MQFRFAFMLAVLGAFATMYATDAGAENKTKPDAANAKSRVKYACDGGVNLVVTYPAKAQAAARPVKLVWNEGTYFLRPAASSEGNFENKKIKLALHTKGEEASLQKAGKPVADKCKATKA